MTRDPLPSTRLHRAVTGGLSGRALKWKRVLLVVVACALAAGCGGAGGSDTSRCLGVSDEVAASIGSTLSSVAASDWAAVKSDGYVSVYFVAARLTGDGVDETAVWATDSLQSVGVTYSVNEIAFAFSGLGEGGRTTANLSMSGDGASEAVDCLG